MRYREAKEIIIRGRERERIILVPVPGMCGHWMTCHQAVVVGCPDCGSKPSIPCQHGRGQVVITKSMVNTIRKLVRDENVTQSQLQDLREKIEKSEVYRAEIHSARKRAWVDAGLRTGRHGKGY